MKYLSYSLKSIFCLFVSGVILLNTGCNREKQMVQPVTTGSHHLAGTYTWRVTRQDRSDHGIVMGTSALPDTVFSINTLSDSSINVLGNILIFRDDHFSKLIIMPGSYATTYTLTYSSDSIFFSYEFGSGAFMVTNISYHAARN